MLVFYIHNKNKYQSKCLITCKLACSHSGKNHNSNDKEIFQKCIIKGEKVLAADRDTWQQIDTSSRKVESDQAQKQKKLSSSLQKWGIQNSCQLGHHLQKQQQQNKI